ncbi:unnamed protein product [Vicia faba]|uniref:Uncharacterized protein n=1 Tax=Vicia faba TaxID=3906 RepID=A0AAV0YS56_VICFA|nr:unnamed protein product [Vicia faba]
MGKLVDGFSDFTMICGITMRYMLLAQKYPKMTMSFLMVREIGKLSTKISRSAVENSTSDLSYPLDMNAHVTKFLTPPNHSDGDRNMILGTSFFVTLSDSVAVIVANAKEAIVYFKNSFKF